MSVKNTIKFSKLTNSNQSKNLLWKLSMRSCYISMTLPSWHESSYAQYSECCIVASWWDLLVGVRLFWSADELCVVLQTAQRLWMLVGLWRRLVALVNLKWAKLETDRKLRMLCQWLLLLSIKDRLPKMKWICFLMRLVCTQYLWLHRFAYTMVIKMPCLMQI